MCGIIGILGQNQNSGVEKQILDGLNILQKRGYDSAGMCTITNSKLNLFKFSTSEDVCGFEKLRTTVSDSLEKNELDYSHIGIGHTRWATHGVNIDRNSQPHVSYDDRFCIVHNGIISNFNSLRSYLEGKGISFKSDTDSEIICNLLAHNVKCHKSRDLKWCIKKTIDCLTGNYAILVIDSQHPNSLFCLTNGPPLLGGFSQGAFTVVSENSAFDNSVSEFFVIKNNDIICVEYSNNQLVFDRKNEYQFISRQNTNFEMTPDPYKHWTIKEIYEQEICVSRIINNYIEGNNIRINSLSPFANILSDVENIILIGCGTSYNACLFAKCVLKDLKLFNTIQVIDGSDLVKNDIPYIGSSIMFLVSQSGETKDVYRCIDIAKSRNVFTVAVVNEVESVIARNSDCVIDILAGKENGVASTKTYTNQVVVLTMIAMHMSAFSKDFDKKEVQEYVQNLKTLPRDIRKTFLAMENKMDQVLGMFDNKRSNFVLGRKRTEGVAREGALKLKEITYIHSEGVISSSLKHGPFAVLDYETPVILLSDSFQENFDYNLSTYHELQARSIPVLWISNFIIETSKMNTVIEVPSNSVFTSLLCIIPIQLLSYHISVKRNLNCDKPRNLAKICTVD